MSLVPAMDRLNLHCNPVILATCPDVYKYCCWCYQTGTPAYHCRRCSLYVCKRCSEMPESLVQHYLHPHHRLKFRSNGHSNYHLHRGLSSYFKIRYEEGFLCDGCLHAHFSPCYLCDECGFKMCFSCVSATASKRPIAWKTDSVFHYSHLHQLTRCRLTDLYSFRWICLICELPLFGVCYGCATCFVFIHESCVDTSRETNHPAHPSHPLRRLDFSQLGARKDEICHACRGYFNMPQTLPFLCDQCDISFHIQCVDSLIRIMKSDVHPHGLLYLAARNTKSDIVCDICGGNIPTKFESFYRCVQCDLTFHFKCISIPSTYKHWDHLHCLTLVDSFVEDDSGEYYCDICERRRYPKCHVYCCNKCKFVGHIECVLSEDKGSLKFFESLHVNDAKSLLGKQMKEVDVESLSEKQMKEVDVESPTQKMQHIHKHPLRLSDRIFNIENTYCDMCNQIMDYPAYLCQSCKFLVHKQCAELPHEFSHPLHQKHPLTLFKPDTRYRYPFICKICRAWSEGFHFVCRTCEFITDVKCAIRYEKRHTNEVEVLIFGGTSLELVNLTGKFALNKCMLCNHKISGLCYRVKGYSKFLHELCLGWPEELQEHTLHSKHNLSLSYLDIKQALCDACGDLILHFGYRCSDHDCKFYLHLECGNSPGRFLKHKLHDFHLYYIHVRPSNGHKPSPKLPHNCFLCQEETNGSFYRCLECEKEFHLKCLRLPQTAKHKWHLHRLTFKNFVDFGGFYCDICEEERDFGHPVYFCAECKSVVVHMDCIVSKENVSNVMIEEIEDDNTNLIPCSNSKGKASSITSEEMEDGYTSSETETSSSSETETSSSLTSESD